jgi:hypothetical protein
MSDSDLETLKHSLDFFSSIGLGENKIYSLTNLIDLREGKFIT